MEFRVFPLLSLLALPLFLFSARPANAISEKGYAENYSKSVLPFLKNGQAFKFRTRDGLELSAVRYLNPNETKGTILVLPGRSEPWLKYGEVFYDLYAEGYSLYSYDHRGQGLSPHLVAKNPEIGHIDKFRHYVEDLEDFMSKVFVPGTNGKRFLLAHSMGGAIAAQYLSRGKTPFLAAVLSAPMLTINTAPYPPEVARLISGGAIEIGLSQHYAPGEHDYDVKAPFSKNDVTSSPERFGMSNAICVMAPRSIIGGPSNGWVHRSLLATPGIVKGMGGITTPTLMFQAGKDQIVLPSGENAGCASTSSCQLVRFPQSQHEILMERDVIRDRALAAIVKFFE